MKKFLLALAAIFCLSLSTFAQVVTTEPAVVQEDTQDLWIFFHADQGNGGLKDLPPTAKVYAHTGVLTSKSGSDSDWKYAPTWLDNSDKYMLEYVSENLWRLYIGNIRTYYNISDPNEMVNKLAFVFRDAGGTREGKTSSGGDIFVDVVESGLQLIVNYGIEGTVVTADNSTLNIKAATTQPADITLMIGQDEVKTVTNAKELTYTYTLPEPGGYIFTVKAKNENGEKMSMTRIYYAQGSPEAPYPGEKIKFGAVENPDGTVTFCVAAPGKQGVNIVGSWDDYQVSDSNLMNRCEDENGRYFWLTVSGLEKGQQYLYYYYVDGQTRVGDPYAKLVLDPSNDKYISNTVYPDMPVYPTGKVSNVCLAVYQSDINEYDWQVKDFKPVDHDNLIIYELLFRDFTGTEGQAKGNGTVRQAMEKIPYLKSLGINAVELLPINEFNGNNSWGYNPNFYFAPDKAYGTPDDYKEFIDKCHAEGIAVILDMVFNQSDWQHPWYRLYSVGSNPFFNATAPHAYSVLNDWNQGNPLVRRQWEDCVQYWLTEYNVDGFRFDLVKGLGDNDSYANSSDSGTNAYNSSRVANMKRIQEAMNAVKPNSIFINENLAGAKEENEMAKTGQLNWANINTEGCQYAMGYSSNAKLNRFYAPDDSRTWGSTVSYLESHDEERLAYKQVEFGQSTIKNNLEAQIQRLGSAAVQMLLSPGAHMIWEFSEMGNKQSTKDANGGNNTSPKVVNWDLLNNPANAALVENYSRLATCRTLNPQLFAKDATYSAQLSNWKTGRTIVNAAGDQSMYTFINPNTGSELTFDYDFPDKNPDLYFVLTQSYGSTCTYDIEKGKVTVPANCFITIAKGKISGVDSPSLTENVRNLVAYGVDGCLNVTNASAPVNVYTLDGRLAATLSGAGSVSLAQGIYLVRSGNETVKVIL